MAHGAVDIAGPVGRLGIAGRSPAVALAVVVPHTANVSAPIDRDATTRTDGDRIAAQPQDLVLHEAMAQQFQFFCPAHSARGSSSMVAGNTAEAASRYLRTAICYAFNLLELQSITLCEVIHSMPSAMKFRTAFRTTLRGIGDAGEIAA